MTKVEVVAEAICDAWAKHEGVEDFSFDYLRQAHTTPAETPKMARMYEIAMAEATAVVEALAAREAQVEPDAWLCIPEIGEPFAHMQKAISQDGSPCRHVALYAAPSTESN